MTTHDYPPADPGGLTVLGSALEPLYIGLLYEPDAAIMSRPGPTLPRVTPEKQPAKVKFTKAIKGRRIS